MPLHTEHLFSSCRKSVCSNTLRRFAECACPHTPSWHMRLYRTLNKCSVVSTGAGAGTGTGAGTGAGAGAGADA